MQNMFIVGLVALSPLPVLKATDFLVLAVAGLRFQDYLVVQDGCLSCSHHVCISATQKVKGQRNKVKRYAADILQGLCTYFSSHVLNLCYL